MAEVAANQIVVDPEFKSLIPPLSPEEYAQLEQNILQDGCREALVVWAQPPDGECVSCEEGTDAPELEGEALHEAIFDRLTENGHRVQRLDISPVALPGWVWADIETENHDEYLRGDNSGWCCRYCGDRDLEAQPDPILIDGHNRLEICTKHDLPYSVKSMSFADHDDAKAWMIRNQLGRRNLTDYHRAELVLALKPLIAKKGKEQQGQRNDLCQNSDKGFKPVDAKKELAAAAGISHDTINKVEKIVELAPEPVKELLRTGEASIHEVHKTIKDCKTKEEAGEKLAVHFSSDSPEWYTPQHIIKAVKDCLGKIDLDPCSNSHDKPNVPAAYHYTAADNGLAQDWTGRVYMNPPYGRTIVEWTEKLAAEVKSGRVTEAVALVPSRTDTAWFHDAAEVANDWCFIRGRLNFSEHENAAPFPSVAIYFGKRSYQFRKAFQPLGIFGTGGER